MEATPKEIIKVAGGRLVKTTSSGKVDFRCFTLKNVSFVPDLESNLISVKMLTNSAYKIIFNGGFCEIFDANKKVLAIRYKNGLYELKPIKSTMFTSIEIVISD